MRYRYLGDPNHATPETIIGPNGEQVPPHDLSDEDGKLYREIIAANKKATGRTLYEPIHEETRKPADSGDKDGQ